VSIKWRNIRRPAATHKRVIWKYAQADFGKAREIINDTDWDRLLTDDINESLGYWQAKFVGIIEDCVPKKVLPKRQNLPWMTRNLTRAMRKRNHLFRCAKKSGSTSVLKQYKDERNKIVWELRRAKRGYFQKLNPSNPKQFWKTVKLMNKTNTSIPVLERSGITATKDSDKASMLN